MIYYIANTEKEKLRYAAKTFYPFEICGIIGILKKNDCNFLTTLFLKNGAINPKRNFRLRRDEIEKGKKVLNDNNLVFCGYFHSHPSTFAIPTSTDKNSNTGSSLWLIYSVCYNELKLYRWQRNNFAICELIIQRE